VTQRDGFARYLEISGSRDAQDLFVAEFGASALQDLRRRWSGAIVGIEVTRVKVETELGPSDRATNDSLSYCFPTKPGYLYTFRFREDGLWRWSGFVRSEHSPPLPDASDWPVFVHRMVSLGATEDECRQLLGEPFTSTGWWPVERLEYALGGIEFRHGIAES